MVIGLLIEIVEGRKEMGDRRCEVNEGICQ